MSENNSQASAPVPTETKSASRFSKIKKHYDLHKRKVIILGLLIALMVVFFNLNPGPRLQDAVKIDPLEFGVVEVTPRDVSVDKNSQIEIKFNFPVTAHHAEPFITMSPQFLGAWTQGSAPNSIVFKPSFEYYAGSQITVTLLEGLPSDTGRKLSTAYSFDFNVKLDGRDMKFVRGDYNYRVTSFSKASGVSLGVLVGSELKEPKATLYKAPDEKVLMSSLQYDLQKYSQNFGYSEDQPDLKGFTEIKSYNINENNHVSYSGDVGIYYLAGYDQGKFVDGTWILINATGLLFRQDNNRVYLAAQDLNTQKELSGLTVTFYNMEKKSGVIRNNVINGITQIPFDYNSRLDLIMAKNGSEVILVPVKLPNSRAENNVWDNRGTDYKVFLTTDRPIYRPGDTVKYRAVVRIDSDGSYIIPVTNTDIKLRASVLNSEWNLKTDASGIASGEFKISGSFPKNPYGEPNYIYLDAIMGDEKFSGSAFFEVAEYNKPDYDLEVVMDKDQYLKKDIIRATIKGKYFNGQPLRNTEVDYIIYRRDYYESESAVYNSSFNLNEWGGMCGGGFGFWDEYYGEELVIEKIKLDNNGEAVVEFNNSTLKSITSQEVTVQAKRTDEKGNILSGAKTAVVRAGNINIFLNKRSVVYDSGEQFNIPFYAENRGGIALTGKDFNYRLYTYNYAADNYSEQNIKTGVVQTDSKGYGNVIDSVDINTWTSVFLEITITDNDGSKVGDSRYISINPRGVKNRQDDPILNVVSEKNNLIVGEIAELTIEAPADMTVFLTNERSNVYDPQWLSLKKGVNSYKFPVRDIHSPSITPTFAFFYQGNYHIEGLSLNVPAMHKVLNTTITTDKSSYKPGEVAKVTIKVTDSNNSPVIANVGVAAVDKAIFALRKFSSLPMHSNFYFFRPRATNASSSMTGVMDYPWGEGGKGGGGGGGAGAFPDKLIDTLFWNPNLRTNANGEITVEIPITDYETTWRVQAYASTSDTKVGQGTADFLVNK